jgi:hypothetical protein
MEAVAWTAIGLLGATVLGSFSSFFYLGTRRIDALGARLDSRIDALSARIDAQDASIQAQGRDLTGAIQTQSLELGSRIDALAARMDDHLGRHAG